MFEFYKYIRPEWYFFLQSNSPESPVYFPDFVSLPEIHKKYVDLDERYSSSKAKKWDAAFQLFQKGYIDKENHKLIPLSHEVIQNIDDNYLFISKYYKKRWLLIIGFIRLCFGNNIIKEGKAISKCFNVKHFNVYRSHLDHSLIEKIEWQKQIKEDQISIVLATLNRYSYLHQALIALEQQTCKFKELIIVDQSDNFKPAFYDQFNLPIKLIRQQGKGQWLARNAALQIAKGEYIAFYEDDVMVDSNWLENHLKAMIYFNADISTGVFYLKGTLIPPNQAYFKYADQFSAANALVKKDVFKKIGLFDLQYNRKRWGDGDMGLRAYLSGFKSILNPLANCVDLKALSGGLRDAGHWEGFQPTHILGPRPMSSVIYFFLKYFPSSHLYAALATKLPLSFIPRSIQGKKWSKPIGLLIFVIMAPFSYFNYRRLKRKAKKMLLEGAKIPTIS